MVLLLLHARSSSVGFCLFFVPKIEWKGKNACSLPFQHCILSFLNGNATIFSSSSPFLWRLSHEVITLRFWVICVSFECVIRTTDSTQRGVRERERAEESDSDERKTRGFQIARHFLFLVVRTASVPCWRSVAHATYQLRRRRNRIRIFEKILLIWLRRTDRIPFDFSKLICSEHRPRLGIYCFGARNVEMAKKREKQKCVSGYVPFFPIPAITDFRMRPNTRNTIICGRRRHGQRCADDKQRWRTHTHTQPRENQNKKRKRNMRARDQ